MSKRGGVIVIKKFVYILSLLILTAGIAFAGGKKDVKPQSTVNTAPPPPPSNPFFIGDGGKGKSIAILAPKASGLAANQNYLPALVQGEFVSNFSGYSAISVLDRQKLDEVYAEQLSGYYNDNTGLDLGHLQETDYIQIGSITRTATGYALQIQIIKTTDKMTAASYSGTCTFAELDNLTGVRRASLDLLQKMGVMPTERAKTELSGAATDNQVNAQTALAQGITAQRQGTEIAALSYYFQAASFDPALLEASSRSNVLTANISSGNIGNDTRNDIQWRKNWIARLEETETFFDNYVKEGQPYYLTYSTDIQWGEIDYQKETRAASIQMGLYSEPAWENSVNEIIKTVKNGLQATNRASAWGINWPTKSVGASSPFTSQLKNYSVVMEIINDKGISIGKQTVNIPYGFNMRNNEITSKEWEETVFFPAVNANLITDRLFIQITSIDGITTANAAKQKKINIVTLDQYEKYLTPEKKVARAVKTAENYFIKNSIVRGDKIIEYTGTQKDIVIPSVINGVTITTIGTLAFSGKGLTNVTIPNSVKSIEGYAFAGNQLTSITIPNSVTSIGDRAFSRNKLTNVTIPNSVNSIGFEVFVNNQLTSVTIPNSITSIGERAFYNNNLINITIPNSVTYIMLGAFAKNQLTSITIGANVIIYNYSVFEGEFRDFYDSNGRKAGTYTRPNANSTKWTWKK